MTKDLKREGTICINNISQALEELREIIFLELNNKQAKNINIKLVKRLRSVEKTINDNL